MADTTTSSILSHQFIAAKGTNTNYHVHIRCGGLGFELIADMPEQTSYAIGADYEAQLPSSTGDSGGIWMNLFAFFTGSHATIEALTRQVWRNSSPLEIPLTLQFDAYDNAYENVYRPMRLLEALAMPTTTISTGYGALPDKIANFASRGNLLWGPNAGNNIMAISIGKMLNLAEVLLISCNNTYDTRLEVGGYPISGQSEVVFRTPKVVTREEWLVANGASL